MIMFNLFTLVTLPLCVHLLLPFALFTLNIIWFYIWIIWISEQVCKFFVSDWKFKMGSRIISRIDLKWWFVNHYSNRDYGPRIANLLIQIGNLEHISLIFFLSFFYETVQNIKLLKQYSYKNQRKKKERIHKNKFLKKMNHGFIIVKVR